jgi:acylphosphatase
MSTNAPARLEATIYGLVQGVFFRQTTQLEAIRLGLTGWVANHPDGTVRVVVEGDVARLRQLLEFLHHGPPGADVERVETNWSAAGGEFTDFRVRYL